MDVQDKDRFVKEERASVGAMAVGIEGEEEQKKKKKTARDKDGLIHAFKAWHSMHEHFKPSSLVGWQWRRGML